MYEQAKQQAGQLVVGLLQLLHQPQVLVRQTMAPPAVSLPAASCELEYATHGRIAALAPGCHITRTLSWDAVERILGRATAQALPDQCLMVATAGCEHADKR